MVSQVEISSFDLRFEGHRLRQKAVERVLLGSIAEKGICEPLQGVDTRDTRILIDGFKRYRCAQKLGIGIVPYRCLSSDTALGIIEFLRGSNRKSLNIVEQARLIDELNRSTHMSTSEIAALLEKSKSWVSVRSGMIHEMSDFVMEKIFSGQFPAYAWLYTIKPFIRINRIKRKEIDEFVGIVSGKKLSTRNIDMLAKGYFKGSDELREQIREGDIDFYLGHLDSAALKGMTQIEKTILRDIELVQACMQRIAVHFAGSEYKSCAFFAQANLLAGGILKQMDQFIKGVKDFHDRSAKA
jgi:hypothetical protein